MRSAEAAAAAAQGGLLLIPVSGGSGSGELQRARLLARSARQRWPQLPIAIAAESAALMRTMDADIEHIALPASPTRSTREVIGAIQQQRPSVVIFDSTARPAQLRAARAVGARVVYLSSRPSARARGFRLGAISQISEHWSVELSLDAALPSRLQRWLLRWNQHLHWRPLGTLFEAPERSQLPETLRQFMARHAHYALFCAGGGGAQIEGRAAGEAFASAARALQAPALVIRGDWSAGRIEQSGDSWQFGPITNAALMALIQSAQLAVVGAGSLLLQTLALGTPTLATVLAGDQSERLKVLSERNAVIECAANAAALASAARNLWTDESKRTQLQAQARALGLSNGLDQALEALAALLPR